MNSFTKNTTEPASRRPTGLTVVGSVFIVFGVLSVVGNGMRLASYPIWELATLFRGLAIVIAVAQIVSGIGVLGLRGWAWPMSLIVAVLIMVINIVGNIVLGTQAAAMLAMAAVGVIANGVIIVYLSQPSTRAWFGRA